MYNFACALFILICIRSFSYGGVLVDSYYHNEGGRIVDCRVTIASEIAAITTGTNSYANTGNISFIDRSYYTKHIIFVFDSVKETCRFTVCILVKDNELFFNDIHYGHVKRDINT